MSDYARVKAWQEANKKLCPDGCGTTIIWKSETCRPCGMVRKRERALDRTVAQVKAENKSKRWTDHVRYFSRVMYEFNCCDICGYDKHVEVAHIIDVSLWPDTATIREINAPENVRGLCPNHHWEFDNGLLKG